MTSPASTGLDPFHDAERSRPLDAILPLDDEAEGIGGWLLGHWRDLTIDDLPPHVREAALAEHASWRTVAEALLQPEVIAAAGDAFLAGVRHRFSERFTYRVTRISLARAGLLDDEPRTLDQLGRTFNITRERVRQLVREPIDEATEELDVRSPLRLVLGARSALHPGTPLELENLADPNTARGRAVRLGLEASGLPQPKAVMGIWMSTAAEARAFDAIVEILPGQVSGARSFADLAARVTDQVEEVASALDLEATLHVLARRLDFGPGLDGRLEFAHAALVRRVARKVVTYLQRRAVPVNPADLAQAVQDGVPPFEPLHRPPVGPDWLIGSASENPDLLQIQPGGAIALARQLAHLRPTGTIGILHSLVVEHGEPMRMIDLCDRAAPFGISRNQVGSYIHSGRAACLFMLSRGIVGLVGRDEGAETNQYEAARPGASQRVRVGDEIGFDNQGRIAADIEVRRSIREQGFALPWPFSIARFSDCPELWIDGRQRPFTGRTNGALSIPELMPGRRVRLCLSVTATGQRISIDSSAMDEIKPIQRIANGERLPVGLRTQRDRPAWIDLVLANLGPTTPALAEAARRMPSVMNAKRRLRALYALVALGLLEPNQSGWRSRGDRRLPVQLAEGFTAVGDDPGCYAVLPPTDQSAVTWLVWATWLVPNVGWSRIRVNDLSDAGAEDEDVADVTPVTAPRETALMRIVEAAHQAEDLYRHPGATEGTDATRAVVRRYLTALGYTAYNAVRELHGTAAASAISVHPSCDSAADSVWLLLPIGGQIGQDDVAAAHRLARDEGVGLAVATNGIQLLGARDGSPLMIDLRTVGRDSNQFDSLISLASDPSWFDAAD
jgi:hypothetical protein